MSMPKGTTCPPFGLQVFNIRPCGSAQRKEDPAIPHQVKALSLEALPAAYHYGNDLCDLEVPQPNLRYFVREFNVDRLRRVYRFLWLAGQPVPPRPLHYHLEASLQIVVSEQMDMHLVWGKEKMFLKPIPRYLFDYNFWSDHLVCLANCDCTSQPQSTRRQRAKDTALPQCARRKVYGVALGFILSYAALIRYESDFHIAHEKRLLPDFVDWITWRALVGELLNARNRNNVDKRFRFGELRWSRLNQIYFYRFLACHGYKSDLASYRDYFRQNLTAIASFFVYIVVVLTAMQVGLATEKLSESRAFQNASFGFTVFSIIGPLALVAVVGFGFLFSFAFNFISAVKFKGARLAMYDRVVEGNV